MVVIEDKVKTLCEPASGRPANGGKEMDTPGLPGAESKSTCEMWDDGDRVVLYSTNVRLVRKILGWKVMKEAGVVEPMAEYFEASTGRLLALQIRFPKRFRNKVAKKAGLPCEKRPISEKQRAALAEGRRKSPVYNACQASREEAGEALISTAGVS